jgi:hypothetical protein
MMRAEPIRRMMHIRDLRRLRIGVMYDADTDHHWMPARCITQSPLSIGDGSVIRSPTTRHRLTGEDGAEGPVVRQEWRVPRLGRRRDDNREEPIGDARGDRPLA